MHAQNRGPLLAHSLRASPFPANALRSIAGQRHAEDGWRILARAAHAPSGRVRLGAVRETAAESKGAGGLGSMQRAGQVPDGAGWVGGGASEGCRQDGSLPIAFVSIDPVVCFGFRCDRDETGGQSEAGV